jgi:dihydroorotate dehydrogenase electron transfer subunit
MSGCRLLGRVAANEPLGSQVRLAIDIPGWPGARPGQFAMLQAEPSRCFLARALSIANELEERVSFMVAPIGEGTQELCDLVPGDDVWVLGPLGNGFDLEEMTGGPGRLVIVAGGIGAAPFPLFLSVMADRRAAARPGVAMNASEESRSEVVVLLGFRDALQTQGAAAVNEAALRLRQAGLSCRVELASEDGSHGPAQKVTDLLKRELRPGDRVAVCGTWAMSRVVWRICSAVPHVRAWFSLEMGMACGVGSCHGCVITLADGSVARVCRDGPVFAGESVFGREPAGDDRGGGWT